MQYQHSLNVAAREILQTQELEGYFRDLGYGAGFGKNAKYLDGKRYFFKKKRECGIRTSPFRPCRLFFY